MRIHVKECFISNDDRRIFKIRIDDELFEKVEGIKSRFHLVETIEEAVKNADLVIEVVVERQDVKEIVLKEISKFVKEDAIIATNSSYMVSSLFKDIVPNPSRLCNLHYFNPALVMKLTEIVKGEHTSEETIQAVYEFSKNTGKEPVILNKEIDGFIVNRILSVIYQEVRSLVEQGYCSYQDVDKACEYGLSHPMGPFKLNDLTGLDLTFDILDGIYKKTGKKPVGYDLYKEFYDKGWYGKKTGRGFYDYTNK